MQLWQCSPSTTAWWETELAVVLTRQRGMFRVNITREKWQTATTQAGAVINDRVALPRVRAKTISLGFVVTTETKQEGKMKQNWTFTEASQQIISWHITVNLIEVSNCTFRAWMGLWNVSKSVLTCKKKLKENYFKCTQSKSVVKEPINCHIYVIISTLSFEIRTSDIITAVPVLLRLYK